MGDGIARFRDFTSDLGPISFKIGEETFTAYGDISFTTLAEISALGQDMETTADDASADSSERMRERTTSLFQRVLVPESFERFQAAVTGDGPTVVGLGWVRSVFPWLLEMYGLRPTEAPSGSSDASTQTGATSTPGAVSAESTPEPSPL